MRQDTLMALRDSIDESQAAPATNVWLSAPVDDLTMSGDGAPVASSPGLHVGC
jgi:hypothetical protein